MKTTKNFSLVSVAILALGLFINSSVFASGNVRFEPITDEGKVLVELEDVEVNKVSISIEDAEQNVVYYTSNVNGDVEFKKVFNVQNLEDGTYCFVANFGNKTLKKEFTVLDSKVITKEAGISALCQPLFRVAEDGKLIVLYQNPEKNTVSVAFNNNNKTFFSHNAEDSKLAARFDVNALPAGEYDVVLNSGKYKYSYSLLVK